MKSTGPQNHQDPFQKTVNNYIYGTISAIAIAAHGRLKNPFPPPSPFGRLMVSVLLPLCCSAELRRNMPSPFERLMVSVLLPPYCSLCTALSVLLCRATEKYAPLGEGGQPVAGRVRVFLAGSAFSLTLPSWERERGKTDPHPALSQRERGQISNSPVNSPHPNPVGRGRGEKCTEIELERKVP